MIHNILVYRWDYDRESAIVSNLAALGRRCIEYRERYADLHMDTVFVTHFINCIREKHVQMVFSCNYIPLLATACEMLQIPYVTWISNVEGHMLRSKTILHPHNYLFCFDRVYSERLTDLGCRHVYHCPLAVDMEVLDDVARQEKRGADDHAADISLICGSDEERAESSGTEGLSDYMTGYIAGVEEAQIRVYGYNFVEKMLDETVARDIQREAGIELGDMFFDDPKSIVAELVNKEITQKEYQRVTEKLSGRYRLDLFTGAQYRGAERKNRINLIIIPKNVQSGIPQSVLDILACGGFCLTNYQQEIAEIFEDGAELVMYTDMEDLAQKVDWYLQNETERAAIARAGCIKVREQFSMRERLAGILETVEETMI